VEGAEPCPKLVVLIAKPPCRLLSGLFPSAVSLHRGIALHNPRLVHLIRENRRQIGNGYRAWCWVLVGTPKSYPPILLPHILNHPAVRDTKKHNVRGYS
jgi:hypothetical protein